MEIIIIIPAIHEYKPAQQIYQQLEQQDMVQSQIIWGKPGESVGCTYNKAVQQHRDGLFCFWDGQTAIEANMLDELLAKAERESDHWNSVDEEEPASRSAENAAWLVLTKQQYLKRGIFHEGLEYLTLLEYVIREAGFGKNDTYYPFNNPFRTLSFETLREGCYILGRYGKYLQEKGWFDRFAEEILRAARDMNRETELIAGMEHMLSRKEEYWQMEAYISPVLILTGDPVCYGVLAQFADGFAKALEDMGYQIEIFNMKDRPWQELRMYQRRHFLAVVGFQTVLFSVHSKENGYLLDHIGGYKMNFLYDHPLNIPEHIQMPLKDYYILTWDREYAQYIKDFYPNVCDAFRVLTAGTVKEQAYDELRQKGLPDSARPYDIVFIGSYHNYRRRFAEMKQVFRETGKTAELFMTQMKRFPNQNARVCLQRALESLEVKVTKDEFKDLLSRLRPIYRCMIDYMREEIIHQLLAQGVELHVFSESWDEWPYDEKNLIRHSSLRNDQTQEILWQSKISLNIMSGHKDGFTERIVNSMLCKAAVVTDKSIYIEETFANEVELCMFDLEHIREIPQILRRLLENEDKRRDMTERAYQIAAGNFTRSRQASEFLDIIRKQKQKEPS